MKQTIPMRTTVDRELSYVIRTEFRVWGVSTLNFDRKAGCTHAEFHWFGSGAHRASYPMSTGGSSPGGKAAMA